jgi:5-methylcytosine-specific restriction endonuclease McrA
MYFILELNFYMAKSNNAKKKQIPKKIRQLVWNEYIGEEKGVDVCFCCRHEKISQMNFQCGHVISEANGGKTNVENLRPICQLCNTSMGKVNMNVFINAFDLHPKQKHRCDIL